MANQTVVIALGHKALGVTLPEQMAAVKRSAKAIAGLVSQGLNIVITHSNAPQVGMIHTAMNELGKVHDKYTMAPMSICSAMSQGYIGYDLQNAIRAELIKQGIAKTVSTMITQVRVDPYDDAFHCPVKIVGRDLTREEADAEEKKGNYVTAVSEGVYKRIVAAPKPLEIIELEAIQALLDRKQIVIACGGGGIPVMQQGYELRGASAVIEKDLTAGLLAADIKADYLLILTGVEKVYLNYKKAEETPLNAITIKEAEEYIDAGQFEANTMLPKIEASIQYLRSKKNGKAIITSIDKALEGFRGKSGTAIQA